MTAIFLTLPVRDPVVARSFFGHLGFRFDAEHSDGQTACMLVDRNIVVVFRADDPGPGSGGSRSAGAGSGTAGSGGPGAGTAGSAGPGSGGADPDEPGRAAGRVVACLTVDSRADVDRVVAAAADRGGRVHQAPGLRGGVYGGSFTDPDGHLWELLCPEL